jgi:type IV pilus assembly protein PilV
MGTGSRSSATGFTLLETLVALAVLAIGALGLLSLASASTRSQQEALFRLRAVAAMDDLTGRVRANPAGLAAYADEAAEGDCHSERSAASACTPVGLAADDLFEWRARHVDLLPAGVATMSYGVADDRSTLDAEIRWRSRDRWHVLSRQVFP